MFHCLSLVVNEIQLVNRNTKTGRDNSEYCFNVVTANHGNFYRLSKYNKFSNWTSYEHSRSSTYESTTRRLLFG